MKVLKSPIGFLGGLPGPSEWKQSSKAALAKLKSTFLKRVSRVSCSSCPAWGHLLSLDVTHLKRGPNSKINVYLIKGQASALDLNIAAALLLDVYSYTSLIVCTQVANLGKHVKREEAVAIYKEILNLGEHMGSNSFNLKLSKIGDPTSEGYQICITMLSDGSVKEQIVHIAKSHNLAVREEKGEVIVYKPKKTE